jgi:glycosyltransferase involved in cell wall biosynthesis
LEENKDIHFLLVGSGDLKEKFEKELNGYKNVTFLPRIGQDQVKYFLDICDILYLSTQHSKVWDYGQSMNKIVEYMLASKPIIASYNGYPSMINEADCGLFVNSIDPLLLKDSILHFVKMSNKERTNIGENGKKWIFSNRKYDLLAKTYFEIISKMIWASKMIN